MNTWMSVLGIKLYHCEPQQVMLYLCYLLFHYDCFKKTLLEKGADIHPRKGQGMTALMCAAQNNYLPLVQVGFLLCEVHFAYFNLTYATILLIYFLQD